VCQFEKWSFFIELMNIVNGQLDYAAFGKLLVKRTGRHRPFIRECIEMGRSQSDRVRIAHGHRAINSRSSFVRAFRKSYGCDSSEYCARAKRNSPGLYVSSTIGTERTNKRMLFEENDFGPFVDHSSLGEFRATGRRLTPSLMFFLNRANKNT